MGPRDSRTLAWERRERLNMGARILRVLELLEQAEELLDGDPRPRAVAWREELAKARRQDFGPFTPARLSGTEAQQALEHAQALLSALGDVDAFRRRLELALGPLAKAAVAVRVHGTPPAE